MQGASVTSMHFRALVCTLRTMVHPHARKYKVKVELYRMLALCFMLSHTYYAKNYDRLSPTA